jgi:hypothetical protein
MLLWPAPASSLTVAVIRAPTVREGSFSPWNQFRRSKLPDGRGSAGKLPDGCGYPSPDREGGQL